MNIKNCISAFLIIIAITCISTAGCESQSPFSPSDDVDIDDDVDIAYERGVECVVDRLNSFEQKRAVSGRVCTEIVYYVELVTNDEDRDIVISTSIPRKCYINLKENENLTVDIKYTTSTYGLTTEEISTIYRDGKEIYTAE